MSQDKDKPENEKLLTKAEQAIHDDISGKRRFSSLKERKLAVLRLKEEKGIPGFFGKDGFGGKPPQR